MYIKPAKTSSAQSKVTLLTIYTPSTSIYSTSNPRKKMEWSSIIIAGPKYVTKKKRNEKKKHNSTPESPESSIKYQASGVQVRVRVHPPVLVSVLMLVGIGV
jgi:hypothetical protein